MMLSINSYAFADDDSKYTECVKNYENNPNTHRTCIELKQLENECIDKIENKISDTCITKYEKLLTECKTINDAEIKKCEDAIDDLGNKLYTDCKSKLSPELDKCETEVDGYISICEKNTINDPNSKENQECKTKAAKTIKCVENICRTQYPLSGTTTGITTSPIPSIPKIDTVVRPNVENVSKVGPYLSSTFLPRVAKTIVSFGIGAAVLGLVLGGIGLLTAYGNDEKYGNAKKGIYFSLIGLVICLLAFAIVQLIFYTGFQAGQIR